MSKNYFYEVNDVENARFELRNRVDPDSKSYTLYKDFTSLFFEGKKLPNGEDVDIIGIIERKKDGESWWEVKIKVGECKIGLGMDYIGPSSRDGYMMANIALILFTVSISIGAVLRVFLIELIIHCST